MTAAATTNPARPGWLFGPAADSLLGCGGLYLVLFALMATGAFGITTAWHATFSPFLVLAVSVPHYGATLLRVYGTREDRHRYRLFALWGAVVVYGVYFLGLNVPTVGSWMLTVYMTWSPWHYSGQNFGVAMTFLRRAGARVDGLPRRLLYASYTLSFVVVALAIHGAYGRPADYAIPGRSFGAFSFHALGLPTWVTSYGVPLALIGTFGCAAAAMWMLRGQLTPRQWIPPVMILTLQSIWFTIPFGLGHFGIVTGLPFIDLATRDLLFTYIALGHATQYLWITSYFARRSRGWTGYGTYWLKAIAFGQIALLVPTLLAVKTPLAGISYDSGVAALLITALNLHHFILDGAIWKLRSGKIASILLRGESTAPPPGEPPAWHRPVFAAGVGLLVGSAVLTTVTQVAGVQRNLRRDDPVAAARALDVLDWVGLDTSTDRLAVGRAFLHAGDTAAAKAQLERSLGLRELQRAWAALAEVREAQGDTDGALAAYDRALSFGDRWIDGIKGGGLVAARAGRNAEAVRRLRPLVAGGQADDETRDAYLRANRALAEAQPQ